jgi:hypothetical protein
MPCNRDKKVQDVYALYQKDKLVRTGLGTSIFWRLGGHAKNKKLVWNTASLFIVRNFWIVRDLVEAVA